MHQTLFRLRGFTMMLSAFILSCQGANGSMLWQDFAGNFSAPVVDDRPYKTTGSASTIDMGGMNVIQLTPEANSQNGSAYFDQFLSAPYSTVQFDFTFSASPGNGGGADGIGFAYLNTAEFGATHDDAMPGFSEEVNLAGSFGVGFDTFKNDGNDGVGSDPFDPPGGIADSENSVSLHYDGNLIVSTPVHIPGDPAVNFSLETGDPMKASIVVSPVGGDSEVTVSIQNMSTGAIITPYANELVPGLQPYDGRMAFSGRTGGANSEQKVWAISEKTFTNVIRTVEPILLADPAPPPPPTLLGGTPFARQNEADPDPTIVWPAPEIFPDVPGTSGDSPGYMRLTNEVGNQQNYIAFDKVSNDTVEIHAEFKFRGRDDGSDRADGMSLMIVPTDTYGDSGPISPVPAVAEDPSLAGSFGLGFKTFQSEEIRVRWDGAAVPVDANNDGTATDSDPSPFQIVQAADIDVWHEAEVWIREVDGGSNVSVTLVDGATGDVFPIMTDEFIAGMDFGGGARVAFGARTGGAADFYEIDDVHVEFVPEPTGLALLGIALASMMSFARRRRKG